MENKDKAIWKKVFSPNKTSAKLFIDYSRVTLLEHEDANPSTDHKKFLILYDLFVKARSYAIINKIAFRLAITGGLSVLIWPAVAIITKDFGFDKEMFKNTVVQTTITAIAALTFAVYSHYKKRQLYMENLMRYVFLSEDSINELKDKVISEFVRIDTGFSFSEGVTKK